MLHKRKLTVLWIALSLAMFAAGCKKKAPPPPPPPPPARRRQGSSRRSRPRRRSRSSAPSRPRSSADSPSTLRWEVSGNVTSVSIDNAIGTVQNYGQPPRFPDRFHHLHPDGHRSRRQHHGLGHGERDQPAAAPASSGGEAHRRPSSSA